MLPNIHVTSIGFAMNLSSWIPISPRKSLGKHTRLFEAIGKVCLKNTLDVLRDIPLTYLKLPCLKTLKKRKLKNAWGPRWLLFQKATRKRGNINANQPSATFWSSFFPWKMGSYLSSFARHMHKEVVCFSTYRSCSIRNVSWKIKRANINLKSPELKKNII